MFVCYFVCLFVCIYIISFCWGFGVLNDDDHEDFIRFCNLFNLFDLSNKDILDLN